MNAGCKDKCLAAGIWLGREQDTFRVDRVTPVLFAENVAGRIAEEEMKVPHSELAMHVGAAGRDILAWVLTGNYAFIVYDDGNCCSFTHGLPGEVLSPSLAKTTRETWGPKEP